MDRSNVLWLESVNRYQDALLIWHEEVTQRKVYCEVTSVSQSEWFEGGRNGLNPQYRFRMFAPDYKGEKTCVFNGQTYTIYRTYIDRNEVIDLYAELKKGNANA